MKEKEVRPLKAVAQKQHKPKCKPPLTPGSPYLTRSVKTSGERRCLRKNQQCTCHFLVAFLRKYCTSLKHD